jgi:hypothetical protein
MLDRHFRFKDRARLRDIFAHSGRKVSLVGWSLGGVYARDLAWLAPKFVRNVITLGSPFTGNPQASNAGAYYEAASGQRGDTRRHEYQRYRETPPVPTTSIYSRTDGIVRWQNSVEREGPSSENIEVESSHIGMGVNPAVLYAIADRLAQPEGKWKRFDQGLRSMFYAKTRSDGESGRSLALSPVWSIFQMGSQAANVVKTRLKPAIHSMRCAALDSNLTRAGVSKARRFIIPCQPYPRRSAALRP